METRWASKHLPFSEHVSVEGFNRLRLRLEAQLVWATPKASAAPVGSLRSNQVG
jgi:hypothetical protein